MTVTPSGYSFTNLASTATTTIKSGLGVLRKIVVNKPLAAAVVTIYDNTAGSGTKIGTITMPATLLTDGPYTVLYDAQFDTGLTVVTTVAIMDLTFVYE
jgi:predicted RecA/RadA family phage recombinase